MNDYNKELQKLSIGMPIFNGELFIHQAIKSILAQTFTNFELIISDNASTDSTREICEKFAKQDNRIRYFRQESNIGIHKNFNFVLKQAKNEYFAWAAVDDHLDNDYMEKNIKVLESDKNIVSSVGKIIPIGTESLDIDSQLIETTQYPKFIKNYIKKNRHKKITDAIPISGSDDQKIRMLLKNTKSLGRFYGVHRTEQLKQCIVDTPFINVEVAIFLNLILLGDFHEEVSTKLYEFDEGISSRGIINMARYSGHNWFGLLFPFYPYTSWCIKNLGFRTYLKNIDIFFRLNLGGQVALMIDLIMILRKKI